MRDVTTQIKIAFAALAFSSAAMVTAAAAMEIGVNTHLAQGRTSWNAVSNAMSDLGADSYRDEIKWGSVQRPDKTFLMTNIPAELLHSLNATNSPIHPLVIADYGNANYGGGQPVTDSDRAGYAHYAKAVVDYYGPHIPIMELWNEWNLGAGNADHSKGSPESYAALVKVAIPEIRKAKTPVKILIGAVGDDLDDWAWTKGVINAGALSLADGYSVHLYNYSAGPNAIPEEMFRRLERLQAILHAAHGSDYPVYVTEFGWPTHTAGVAPEIAGAYIARFLLEASGYSWLKGAWVYELFDGGTDKTNREQNFGLYDTNGKIKPGTCNVKAAIHLLDNYHLVAKGSLKAGVRWLQMEDTGSKQSAFVFFNSIRNGSAVPVSLNTTAVPLCAIAGGPPSAPELQATEITVATAKAAPSNTVAAETKTNTVSVTETPFVTFVNGVNYSPAALFTNM